MMDTSIVDSLLRSVTFIFSEWPEIVLPCWPYITFCFVVIFLIYICYCCNEGGIHYVTTERVPIIMRQVTNPFTFDLNPQNAESPDVSCTVSTKKNCYVLPFWGVPGSDLFEVLKLDWISMKHDLMENHTSFKNKCLASSPSIRLNSGHKVLSFMPPSSLYEDESINPRLFLPLVIVMLLDEDTVENIEQPIVFVQAVIVHVPSIFNHTNMRNVHNRDPSIPFTQTQRIPAVLGIYVKESHSSTIGVVKRVYDGSLYSENLNGEEVPVCVACCQRRVNTVIFPCLHASLCTLCYHQCEVCPSCRGPVFYYFTTGPIIEIPQENT